MASLADLLEDFPAVGRNQGRSVQNTGGVGLRRPIDESYRGNQNAQNDAGSQPGRSDRR
jgi:hypothetical protein